MSRAQVIVLAVGGIILAFVAESYFGTTRYRLNGVTYAVPHQYEFMRNFRVSWLEGIKGLDKEPDESIWLLLPASQLARDVPGYSPMFHGYSGDVEADMVVNVLGGKEAHEFPEDYARRWREVADLEKGGAPRQPDPATGWDRVISLGGEKGTPADGHANFYLIPKPGKPVPHDLLPSSCLASPDINGGETYYCSYTIYRNGLTFGFRLQQESLRTANRIPAYILARLGVWRS